MSEQPPSFEGPQDFSDRPPVGAAQPGQPTQDDRTWALIAHLGQIVLGFIAPLIVLLVKGNQSQWVKREATEALNFSIVFVIAILVSIVLSVIVIGVFTMAVAGVGYCVLAIVAGVKSYNGESYRYPVNIRFVK